MASFYLLIELLNFKRASLIYELLNFKRASLIYASLSTTLGAFRYALDYSVKKQKDKGTDPIVFPHYSPCACHNRGE